MRFRNSFVTTPICAASRASLLTGLYERTHKFTFGTPPIAAAFCANSYPFLLRQAGYRTALIGKFGVNVDMGQAAEMFDLLVPIGSPFQRKKPSGEIRHIDQIATDRAIEFLKEQTAKQPFCLSISFNSPHAEDGKLDNLYPWPKTVDGLYDDVRIPAPPLVDEKYFQAEPEFLRKALNRIRWYWQFDTPEKYAKNVRAYYRMISGIDHEIGRLLAALERLGVLENTVVVFMSDNGYFLGERGFSGKWVHYEESLRVPMLIVDPRLPAERRGKTADEMVLNLDIAPTLLTLAGLEVPKEYQGHGLMPLESGGRKAAVAKRFLLRASVREQRHPAMGRRARQTLCLCAVLHAEAGVRVPARSQRRSTKELKDPGPRSRNVRCCWSGCGGGLWNCAMPNGGPYSPERFPVLPKQ